MARQRNYAAEYARRVASAERRGLSRSQARGHARVGRGELPASRVRVASVYAVTPTGVRVQQVQVGDRDQRRAGQYMADTGRLLRGEMTDREFTRRWGGRRIGGVELVTDPAEVRGLAFVTDPREVAFANSPERSAA